MKFWRGNKVDAEFDMPTAEVADKFVEWANTDPTGTEGLQNLPLERVLRAWLTDSDHFNSTWVDEKGPESFATLYDAVYDRVFPRKDPVTPAQREAFRATARPTRHGRRIEPTPDDIATERAEARTADELAELREYAAEDDGTRPPREVYWRCGDCEWLWPLPGQPTQGAECDNCGGELVKVVVAYIDGPPTFSGDPDYSVNHVS